MKKKLLIDVVVTETKLGELIEIWFNKYATEINKPIFWQDNQVAIVLRKRFQNLNRWEKKKTRIKKEKTLNNNELVPKINEIIINHPSCSNSTNSNNCPLNSLPSNNSVSNNPAPVVNKSNSPSTKDVLANLLAKQIADSNF